VKVFGVLTRGTLPRACTVPIPQCFQWWKAHPGEKKRKGDCFQSSRDRETALKPGGEEGSLEESTEASQRRGEGGEGKKKRLSPKKKGKEQKTAGQRATWEAEESKEKNGLRHGAISRLVTERQRTKENREITRRWKGGKTKDAYSKPAGTARGLWRGTYFEGGGGEENWPVSLFLGVGAVEDGAAQFRERKDKETPAHGTTRKVGRAQRQRKYFKDSRPPVNSTNIVVEALRQGASPDEFD